MPQVSFAVSFKLNLLQSITVSVEANSAAVLPKPVGLMMPDAGVPFGRFMLMICRIWIESPFTRILINLGA